MLWLSWGSFCSCLSWFAAMSLYPLACLYVHVSQEICGSRNNYRQLNGETQNQCPLTDICVCVCVRERERETNATLLSWSVPQIPWLWWLVENILTTMTNSPRGKSINVWDVAGFVLTWLAEKTHLAATAKCDELGDCWIWSSATIIWKAYVKWNWLPFEILKLKLLLASGQGVSLVSTQIASIHDQHVSVTFLILLDHNCHCSSGGFQWLCFLQLWFWSCVSGSVGFVGVCRYSRALLHIQ